MILALEIIYLAIVVYDLHLRDSGLVAIKSDTEKGKVPLDFGDYNIQERLNRIADENVMCIDEYKPCVRK